MRFHLFNKKTSFKHKPETLCITCCHVLHENATIRYISHDEDDIWQFLCGENHISEEARVVSLSEIISVDKNVVALSDLNCGEYAELQNGKWMICKKSP